MATKKMESLARTMEALRSFREQRSGMEVQAMIVFLDVAVNEGQPMKFYADRADVSQSGISRIMALLGRGYNPKEPGLGLVDAKEDPWERRRKIISLTPKGKRMAAQLSSIITGKE